MSASNSRASILHSDNPPFNDFENALASVIGFKALHPEVLGEGRYIVNVKSSPVAPVCETFEDGGSDTAEYNRNDLATQSTDDAEKGSELLVDQSKQTCTGTTDHSTTEANSSSSPDLEEEGSNNSMGEETGDNQMGGALDTDEGTAKAQEGTGHNAGDPCVSDDAKWAKGGSGSDDTLGAAEPKKGFARQPFDVWHSLASPDQLLSHRDSKGYATITVSIDSLEALECLPVHASPPPRPCSTATAITPASTAFPTYTDMSPTGSQSIASDGPKPRRERKDSNELPIHRSSLTPTRKGSEGHLSEIGSGFSMRQSLLVYLRFGWNGEDIYRSRVAYFPANSDKLFWQEVIEVDVLYPMSRLSLMLFDKDYPDKLSSFCQDELLGVLDVPIHLLRPDVPHSMSVDIRCLIPEAISIAACIRANAEVSDSSKMNPSLAKDLDLQALAGIRDTDVHPPSDVTLRLKVQFLITRNCGSIGEVAAMALPPPYINQPSPKLDCRSLFCDVVYLKNVLWDGCCARLGGVLNDYFHDISNRTSKIAVHIIFVCAFWMYPARSLFLSLFVLAYASTILTSKVIDFFQFNLLTDQDSSTLLANRSVPGTESELAITLLNSALNSETSAKAAKLMVKINSVCKTVQKLQSGKLKECRPGCLRTILSMSLAAVAVYGFFKPKTTFFFIRLILFCAGSLFLASDSKAVAIPLRLSVGITRFVRIQLQRSKPSAVSDAIRSSCRPCA